MARVNTRTEVMEQVDARRNDAAFMGRLHDSVQQHKPVLDRLADERTPMFEEVAGEDLEHVLGLLTTRPPTAEEICADHPRGPGR